MKISASDEYACAAGLDLALNYDGESPVRVQDIAQLARRTRAAERQLMYHI